MRAGASGCSGAGGSLLTSPPGPLGGAAATVARTFFSDSCIMRAWGYVKVTWYTACLGFRITCAHCTGPLLARSQAGVAFGTTDLHPIQSTQSYPQGMQQKAPSPTSPPLPASINMRFNPLGSNTASYNAALGGRLLLRVPQDRQHKTHPPSSPMLHEGPPPGQTCLFTNKAARPPVQD